MAQQPTIMLSVAGAATAAAAGAAVIAVLAVADDLATRGRALEDGGNNGSIYAQRSEGRGAGYCEAARLIRAAVQDSMPKEPEYAHCTGPECTRQWEVSQEDPDATMGDMLEHAVHVHGEMSPTRILKEGKRP